MEIRGMNKSYTNIKLPDELTKEIDSLIEDRTLGYRSRGEFVAEATRRLLMEVNMLFERQEAKRADSKIK